MRPVLVLWDVDHTLVHAGRAGSVLYEIVLAELYGRDLPGQLTSMAGRTDTSIALEVLAAAGLDPTAELHRFQETFEKRAPEVAGLVREHGVVLPGVREALAAVADHAADGPVVQSLLTGNAPALAKVKLHSLGLTEYLDFDAGAYGDVSPIRAELVPVAQQNAKARYGTDFSGRATVLVGDTPHDIAAAAASGARAVAVATGRFSAAQLADAGPDVVLPDLASTERVVAALLGA